jgi:hypothetical protein
LTGLVKKIDAFVRENKKSDAKAFVVLIGKDDEETRGKLKKFAKDEKLELPITVSADKAATVKTLKLDEKVKSTVLVYREKKVVANFALDKIGEKDVEAILAAAKENLAPPKKP